MPAEKALGLVVRTTDFSETSRIATIWTREFGKVRVLAKGGRRLKSSFESALDLLSVCSMVFLRKASGGLDLLTEARVVERFGQLRHDLAALYAGYYIAELLGIWTEDYDPHPRLFDEAVATLRELGQPSERTGLRLMRFETVLLKELGYTPVLDRCASCQQPLPESGDLLFSASAGGMVCGKCRQWPKGLLTLARATWQALLQLADEQAWKEVPAQARAQLRDLFNQYVSHLLGRRPRTMAYLGS